MTHEKKQKFENIKSENDAELLSKFQQVATPSRRKISITRWFWRMVIWRALVQSTLLIKRVLDIVLSLFLLVTATIPLLLVSCILLVTQKKILHADACYDQHGESFLRYHFNLPVDSSDPWVGRLLACCSLYKWPILLNVLKGNLSVVGPTSVLVSTGVIPEYVRQMARPGLTNPYLLRQMVNIAHESQTTADREYIHQQSFRGDIGVLLRSLLVLPSGKREVFAVPLVINMLDIRIRNLTMSEAVDALVHAATAAEPSQLAFVNPDCMNVSCINVEYKALLQRLTFVLADGIGIHIACKMLHIAMADNVNGTDMFPYLCARAEKDQIPLYFLGGKPGVAEDMVALILQKYPRLIIAGYKNGYFTRDEEAGVIRAIRESGAKILLVAFGAPRQDLWIDQHLCELGVGVALGVGGLFDFMSGRTKRAPRWLRELGLEWTYRLLQEPGRMWRRYVIGNPLFILRILRWRRTNPVVGQEL